MSDCKTDKSAACGGGALYGIGFIGAAVYFIQHATGFWGGVWGFIKAFAWPALVVHKLMTFLGM